MNNILTGSVIRFLMGALSFWLASKGVDAVQAENIINGVMALIPALGVAGASYAWSVKAHDVKTPDVKTPDVLKDNPIINPKQYAFSLSDRSKNVLSKVDPLLSKLFETSIINSPYDFTVYHGLRTDAEQAEMIRSNKSWVSRSKHQDGRAVDLFLWVNGQDKWDDYAAYTAVADHIKDCANRLNIPIVWGGDWKKRDMVHFELA